MVLSNSSSKNNSTAASKKDGTKVSVASGREKVQPRKKAFAKVQIAKSCRRTPNQVKAADIQCNEAITSLQAAYKWTVSEKENYSNKVELASVALSKFNVTVVPQTLRKLLREGRDQIMPPGPKPVMDDEDFKAISGAFCSFIAIAQVNGNAEKKFDMIAVLKNTLFLKLKRQMQLYWTYQKKR
jgi:hypothetical protein